MSLSSPAEFLIQSTTDPIQAPKPAHEIARRVLDILFRHRRLLPDAIAASLHQDSRRYAVHAARMQHQIAAGAPLQFILPAFPAKSPNRTKTISPLPDLGERVALQFLQALCAEIESVYSAGATLTICSDGRVFGGLVGIHDEDVTAYRNALRKIVDDIGATSLKFFSLEDVFEDDDFDMMRDELLVMHGRTVAEIRAEARIAPEAKALFNGIHRFMFEDLAARHPAMSRTQCRDKAKLAAYRVIQRSNAWSEMLAERFPHALRLSIHPQPDVSEKIGIAFMASEDPWMTPWHAVAVCDEQGIRLLKRCTAESMGATLAHTHDRLAYYQMPQARPAPAFA